MISTSHKRFRPAWSLVAQVLYTVPSRLLSRLSPNFATRLPTQHDEVERIIYLTFDDGPTTGHTAALLDVLDRFNAHASFFLTTEGVAGNETSVRAIAEAGHVV